MTEKRPAWIDDLRGWLGSDMYSTAWVALVPSVAEPDCPAWPEALQTLRDTQLDDGGWGEEALCYVHERTLNTLAAIRALYTWQAEPDDRYRVEQGLAALRQYASKLEGEPHEPIGFELLLPALRRDTVSSFGNALPLDQWAYVDKLNGKKLALIENLRPEPFQQATWWFSMEMLPEEQLRQFDDKILDAMGAIATSTAATAAYLMAKRRAGADSPRAAEYLQQVIEIGGGAVPVGWPFEVFERVWVLDSLMRAGLSPDDLDIKDIVDDVRASWDAHEPGLAYSDTFFVNDADDTLVGFAVLNWAGCDPSDEAVMDFWDGDHFAGYKGERGASASVNIHALTALRSQPGCPHHNLIDPLVGWLRAQMKKDVLFDDKWHISPMYSVSHAVTAFAGIDDQMAQLCVSDLVEKQHEDGGWGFSRSTVEETSHCVLALTQAFEHGLLEDEGVLERAADFLEVDEAGPEESLWIGKTLYHPEGIVEATLFAAKTKLQEMGYMASIEMAA
ncbi:MAG: hypothetical protein JXJ17_01155 [Anaerolineae bacterium]|nr:hypothetical protein [Anaerolineae bacterium]